MPKSWNALIRRPPKGLLGGMLGLPTSDWSEAPDGTPPVAAAWREAGAVEHVFTHFSLTLRLLRAEGDADGLIWTPPAGLEALPSVFLKAVRTGLSNLL